MTSIPRVAVEDFTWQGHHPIRRGQVVQLSLASADRDATHFPDGERFEIKRTPGQHFSFGPCPHGCLAASLAWEEACIALETLFRRMPGLRLDEQQTIRWYRNAGNRGPITLPLRVYSGFHSHVGYIERASTIPPKETEVDPIHLTGNRSMRSPRASEAEASARRAGTPCPPASVGDHATVREGWVSRALASDFAGSVLPMR